MQPSFPMAKYAMILLCQSKTVKATRTPWSQSRSHVCQTHFYKPPLSFYGQQVLPRFLSRISLLKFLKFHHLFSCALFCSLSYCSSQYDFPREKRRLPNTTLPHDFWPKKIVLTLQSPEAVLPPDLQPDSLYGQTDGHTHICDVITKISCMDRFPKGALLARFACLSSAILYKSTQWQRPFYD